MDIKVIRQLLHLTQSEFAKKIEVHTLTVSRWERGIRKPRPIYIRKIERIVKRRIIEGYKAMGEENLQLAKEFEPLAKQTWQLRNL